MRSGASPEDCVAMTTAGLFKALLTGALVALAIGCGGAASPEPPAGGNKTAGSKPAAKGGTTKVDLNAIFPPGEGRDLVLNNCQSCHTFVPIVVLQMDRDQWTRSSLDHRERLPKLDDATFKTVYEYLIANFNPSRPVPELPKELLETWTSY
jgi:cytochrome c5